MHRIGPSVAVREKSSQCAKSKQPVGLRDAMGIDTFAIARRAQVRRVRPVRSFGRRPPGNRADWCEETRTAARRFGEWFGLEEEPSLRQTIGELPQGSHPTPTGPRLWRVRGSRLRPRAAGSGVRSEASAEAWDPEQPDESGDRSHPDRSERKPTSARTPRGRDFGRASSGFSALVEWAARTACDHTRLLRWRNAPGLAFEELHHGVRVE